MYAGARITDFTEPLENVEDTFERAGDCTKDMISIGALVVLSGLYVLETPRNWRDRDDD